MLSAPFTAQYLITFSKNWGKFLALGIALVILGAIAISAATMTTVISIIFLGLLLVIAGVVILVLDIFTFWWSKWSGFLIALLFGILYLVVGSMLIGSPITASISITLFLGIFYLVVGVFRTIYYLFAHIPGWRWGITSGIIAAILGILILSSWPSSGLYIIGLFIGIDLLFTGWAYIMAALAARSLAK